MASRFPSAGGLAGSTQKTRRRFVRRTAYYQPAVRAMLAINVASIGMPPERKLSDQQIAGQRIAGQSCPAHSRQNDSRVNGPL